MSIFKIVVSVFVVFSSSLFAFKLDEKAFVERKMEELKESEQHPWSNDEALAEKKLRQVEQTHHLRGVNEEELREHDVPYILIEKKHEVESILNDGDKAILVLSGGRRFDISLEQGNILEWQEFDVVKISLGGVEDYPLKIENRVLSDVVFAQEIES